MKALVVLSAALLNEHTVRGATVVDVSHARKIDRTQLRPLCPFTLKQRRLQSCFPGLVIGWFMRTQYAYVRSHTLGSI